MKKKHTGLLFACDMAQGTLTNVVLSTPPQIEPVAKFTIVKEYRNASFNVEVTLTIMVTITLTDITGDVFPTYRDPKLLMQVYWEVFSH
jgi:hypothetical protein